MKVRIKALSPEAQASLAAEQLHQCQETGAFPSTLEALDAILQDHARIADIAGMPVSDLCDQLDDGTLRLEHVRDMTPLEDGPLATFAAWAQEAEAQEPGSFKAGYLASFVEAQLLRGEIKALKARLNA